MVLVRFVQFHKITAPAPYADNQVSMRLWMCLCIKQLLPVNRIELQLVSAQAEEALNKGRYLANAPLFSEQRIMVP